MSEFKFACPVCGQHMTVDSGSSGKVVECPTCLRGIVVPQAPSGPDSKLILTGSQVAKPRPSSIEFSSEPLGHRRVSRAYRWRVVTAAVVLVGVAGGAWALRAPFVSLVLPPEDRPEVAAAHSSLLMASRTPYPIPTGIHWSTNLSKAAIPDSVAAGSVGGLGFKCEKASFQNGKLTLRQGKMGTPYMRVTVQLTNREPEELNGKSIEVAPDRRGPKPRVSFRVQDEDQPALGTDLDGGYALRLTFGQTVNGRIPGRIYLCLPDETKSFVAGVFDAEIKRFPSDDGRPSAARR